LPHPYGGSSTYLKQALQQPTPQTPPTPFRALRWLAQDHSWAAHHGIALGPPLLAGGGRLAPMSDIEASRPAGPFHPEVRHRGFTACRPVSPRGKTSRLNGLPARFTPRSDIEASRPAGPFHPEVRHRGLTACRPVSPRGQTSRLHGLPARFTPR